MEKVKEKSKYGFLLAILKILGIIVGVVALILIALYFYIRVILGIDIFGIIGILKNLGADYDPSKILTNTVTQEITDETFDKFDAAGLSGIYTNTNGEYKINDDISTLPTATANISFTDAELCALMQTLLDSSIELAEGEKLELEIKQVTFSDYKSMANGAKIKVNVVFYTSLSTVKTSLNVFPLTLITKYIPENAYISANFYVEQTGALTYTVTPDSMTINNLSKTQTSTVLSVIGSVIGEFDMFTLCEEIGNIMFNSLIGDSKTSGFVKELDVVGITAYSIDKVDSTIYFTMKI